MANDSKAVALRFYEAFDPWKPEMLDDLVTPDYRGHAGAGGDLQQLKQSIGSFVNAFPDLKTEIVQLVCEGDMVASWVTYTGTHQGPFAGVPGSGREMRIAGWDLFRIEGDKIAELTQHCDVFTLMNQIGALPTAAAV